MKSVLRKLFSAVMAAVMAVTILPINLFPLTASAVYFKPGSIITFGMYPQSRITDPILLASLNSSAAAADSNLTWCRAKYKRVCFKQYTPYNSRVEPTAENSYQDDNGYYVNRVYWFKYEPIKWRVLSNTNGELFVISEKILDSLPYHSKYDKITWETSTIRTWLNNDFYNSAFTFYEKARIKTGDVINDDNPFYGTEGGNGTKDKLFFLSFKEVMNTAYGFENSTSVFDTARVAYGTDYAKSQGLFVYNPGSATTDLLSNSSYWWLRSPGRDNTRAGYINYMPIDMIGAFYVGADVDSNTIGVRPALKLNGITILTTVGSANCVVDAENNLIFGLNAGITTSELESSISFNGDTVFKYTPDTGTIGTGTQVNVVDIATQAVLATYTVIIFGDVNGDGIVDALDADSCVNIQNWTAAWNPHTQGFFYKSGDVNGDGNIDALDADILSEVTNWRMAIDQTTGLADVVT